MKIAVYSGSFNPLHVGHQAIMEYLTTDEDFDWVYLVISPQSPFKDKSNCLTGDERYHNAVAAVRRHPDLHVWVDNIELSMPAPHYTLKTLDALKKRERSNSFTLVIGADNLACMREWFGYQRILREYGVITYPRPGFDAEALAEDLRAEDPSYRIEVISAKMVDMSSTRIRKRLLEGAEVSEMLM